LFNQEFKLANFKNYTIVEFEIKNTVLYVNLENPKILYFVEKIPINLQMKMQSLGYQVKVSINYDYYHIPQSYVIRSIYYHTIIFERDLNYDSSLRYLISEINFTRVNFINTFLVLLSCVQLQLINTSLNNINFLTNIENIHITIQKMAQMYAEFSYSQAQDNITLREAIFRLTYSSKKQNINKLFDNTYKNNENKFFDVTFLIKYFQLNQLEVKLLYSYLMGYHDENIQQMLDLKYEITHPKNQNELKNRLVVKMFHFLITPVLIHLLRNL
jgi:hypothetical protein